MFEILLCIGNKADIVPGHSVQVCKKLGESSSDPHPNYYNFGINESEDCSLLFEEEPYTDIRNSIA
jgi:alpha- and gamma-adaptin-binding protein p34